MSFVIRNNKSTSSSIAPPTGKQPTPPPKIFSWPAQSKVIGPKPMDIKTQFDPAQNLKMLFFCFCFF